MKGALRTCARGDVIHLDNGKVPIVLRCISPSLECLSVGMVTTVETYEQSLFS